MIHILAEVRALKSIRTPANLWRISETDFDPDHLLHKETIFTIGNGYLCTRGTFEEGYPGERRATFVHGVFDAARNVNTELVNEPDWLPLSVYLNGERFGLDRGTIEAYDRSLDLRSGLLTRTVRWRSPEGLMATLIFERFASLADLHALYLRCRVIPEFSGMVEFRASINGNTETLGVIHSQWIDQGEQSGTAFLRNRTRVSKIESVYAMQAKTSRGEECARNVWDVENRPSVMVRVEARSQQEIVLDKHTAVYTSRDVPANELVLTTLDHLQRMPDWEQAFADNTRIWAKEWERSDILIEGDDTSQLVVRFNLFHLLIAAPRLDDRVSIGARTLSGFGYHGHVFWDTEIFMLPFFTFTAPDIARNLLNYRYSQLDAARAKARGEGHEGAQFAWESADTGEEVTPTWIPDPADRRKLVRIWTGDIEIHISADVAYAVHQYWQVTGDDAWFIQRGAEIILDTAKFWASRAEWNPQTESYEYCDVIGPDEYHDHVDNNAYTNRMAQWNLQTALDTLKWLKTHAPDRANALISALDLSTTRLSHWQQVIEKIHVPIKASGLIEQFEGYSQLKPVYMAALEPRDMSTQRLFGIAGSQERQAIKQADVLMLLYLLRGQYEGEVVRVNYDYYTPRTDLTCGSSLGPAIQAIMACEVGMVNDAYKLFQLAAQADLFDLRGNAGDGIHGASAGGTWQAIVFGFARLHIGEKGWTATPRLPEGWKRLSFKFQYRGVPQLVDIENSHQVGKPSAEQE